MRFRSLITTAAIVVAATPLTGADLSGRVIDGSGLAVPRAQINIACVRSTQSREADGGGNFYFGNLPEGPCRIHIEQAGFEPFEKHLIGAEGVLRVQLVIKTRHDSIVVKTRSEDSTPRLGAVSLDATELTKISNDPKVWVNYAQLLAGAAITPLQIYVDGLPAEQLPPAARIARIVVNPDTFSVEYADGGSAHIDIITKAPDHQLRFNLGSDALASGGGSALALGTQASSHSLNGSISGAIPNQPFAFALVASASETSVPVFVTAVLPSTSFSSLDSVRFGAFTTKAFSVSPDLYYYPSEKLRLHLSHMESRSSGRNLGAGGLTLMDAGTDNSFVNRETRLTFDGDMEQSSLRGGLVIDNSGLNSRARNTQPGLNVLGDFVTGGPEILNSNVQHLAWTWKTVFEHGASTAWSAGINVAGIGESRFDAANPGGVFTFADLDSYVQFLNGFATAKWAVLKGDGKLHARQVDVSPFFQRPFWRSAHLLISGGLRADAQSSVGAFVSPRVSAALEWHGFVIRTGAGMFAHYVPEYVFVRAIQDDGTHLTPVIIDNASMDALAVSAIAADSLVRTSLSSRLSLPRQFIGKATVNRTFGRITPGIEYTQTHDWMLLGSQRFASAYGWMDVIASNRTRIARQLQSQLAYSWRGQRLTVYHQWVSSYDNTDGPFSFPQAQNDLAAEWARSAGRPRENLTFAGSFSLRSIILTLTDSWHGSAPYNITDTADVEGDGLFNDRGSRPRNSGNGPSFNSLSGYLSHRFTVTRAFGRTVHGVTIGLRGDNLLGNRNYLSVGAVAGSPTFGQPLVAAPGRSIRMWFSLD